MVFALEIEIGHESAAQLADARADGSGSRRLPATRPDRSRRKERQRTGLNFNILPFSPFFNPLYREVGLKC